MINFLNHFPYLGLFIVLVLGGIGFPFPEGVTLIICGFLIGAKIVDPLIVSIIAYLGILTGDCISFSLGKKYGRAVLSFKVFKKFLPHFQISNFEKRFVKFEVPFMLIAGRLISGVFLVAGILGIRWPKFLLTNAISALLAIIIWFGVGYAGGSSLAIIRTGILRIEHVAAFLLILLAVVVLLYVHFRADQE